MSDDVYGPPRSRERRARPPAQDEDTAATLEAAIERLARSRCLWPGDASVTLHVLASIVAEASSRLPRAVADARAEGLSWADVADLLGTTRSSAWERYRHLAPEEQ
jgi:hypothetical protein